MQIHFSNINMTLYVFTDLNWNRWNTILWSVRETWYIYVHWALNWNGENSLYMNPKDFFF